VPKKHEELPLECVRQVTQARVGGEEKNVEIAGVGVLSIVLQEFKDKPGGGKAISSQSFCATPSVESAGYLMSALMDIMVEHYGPLVLIHMQAFKLAKMSQGSAGETTTFKWDDALRDFRKQGGKS
jgi:hypothetical protein